MIKIVLLGQERGVYRWEETLRYFESSEDIILIYRKRKPLTRIFSYVNRIKRGIRLLFDISISDVVWLLPMSDKDLFFILFARLIGKDVVVDYYSSREDVVISNGNVNHSAVSLWSIFRYRMIDRVRIIAATKLIFLTHVELHIAKARFPFMRISKCAVIPLVIPHIEVTPTNKYATRSNECLNIVWWGGISKLHRLDYMIAEVGMLSENFKFWVFDNSNRRINSFKEKYPKLNLEKVTFRSDLTFDSGLWDWVSVNADIILGVFGTTELSNSVVPNKVVQGAYFSKPIITRKSEAYGKEVLNFKGLFLIDPIPGSLIKAIETARESKTAGIHDSEFTEFTNRYSINNFRKQIEALLIHE